MNHSKFKLSFEIIFLENGMPQKLVCLGAYNYLNYTGVQKKLYTSK